MIQKNCCHVCESHNVKRFISHQDVPVHQNFLINDQKLAIGITRGDLDLAVCEECGFVFNQSFDLSKLSYGMNYDNTQDYSPSFNTYVSNLARSLVFDKNVKNCSIVEVGCGKGSFLRKLVEVKEGENKGHGFDPSYVGLESDLDGRLKFEKRFYDQKCADIHADVIVCRHVIEHVPDPLNLLRTIRQALIHSPQARVFFETPSVEYILRNQVIWDFFYEHCSYFTAQSLTTAFETSGVHVDNVSHIFGGNICG